MSVSCRRFFCGAFLVFLMSLPAFGQTYSIQSIGLLPGYTSSYGFDINESGHVLGLAVSGSIFYPYCDPDSLFGGQGFISASGTLRQLPKCAGDLASFGLSLNANDISVGKSYYNNSYGYGSRATIFSGTVAREFLNTSSPLAHPIFENETFVINDAGRAGGVTVSQNTRLPFLLESGTAYHLADPTQLTPEKVGWYGASVRGINAVGEVLIEKNKVLYKLSAGMTVVASADGTRRLYTANSYERLGSPDSTTNYLRAFSLNNAGKTVGYYSNSSGYHAFVYADRTFTEVPPLAGRKSILAYDINNTGHIVGWSGSAQGIVHAFVRFGAVNLDLNTITQGVPASNVGFTELLSAYAVNDSGQITGVGRWREAGGDITLRGFILTPVYFGNKVAPPMITPDGGSFDGLATVTLSSWTPGSTIYYSVDDSVPNIPYTAPLQLTAPCHVRAVAKKAGMSPSDEAVAPFYISPPSQAVAAPVISPNGGTFYDSRIVQVQGAEGTTIRYSKDGSDPRTATISSTTKVTLSVTESCTLRAVASKLGFQDSESAASFVILQSPQLDPPVISPEGGDFKGSVTVSISYSGTEPAYINYRLDDNGGWFRYTAPFILNRAAIVQAYADPKIVVSSRKIRPSQTVTAVFTTSATNSPTPVITPAGGTFQGAQLVTLSVSPTSAPMFFSLDGSEPTTASFKYSAPFFLTESGTLKVRSIEPDKNHSDLASAIFTIIPSVSTAATPTLAPAGGTFVSKTSVKIQSATSGASIRYTLDGSEPTGNSPAVGKTFKIEKSCTLRVRAFKNGLEPSESASADYVITLPTLAAPRIKTRSGSYTGLVKVSISAIPSKGTTIRYTTDGTDPDATSPAYQMQLELHDDTVLKAKAWNEAYIESPIAQATYVIKPRVP